MTVWDNRQLSYIIIDNAVKENAQVLVDDLNDRDLTNQQRFDRFDKSIDAITGLTFTIVAIARQELTYEKGRIKIQDSFYHLRLNQSVNEIDRDYCRINRNSLCDAQVSRLIYSEMTLHMMTKKFIASIGKLYWFTEYMLQICAILAVNFKTGRNNDY